MINIFDSSVQQCKPSYGVNMVENILLKEMLREISICQFSLSNSSQPLIIEDLMEDERTKNFLIIDGAPNFRFYPGSPMINSRWFSEGTICFFDPSPKKLSHQQIEGLCLLGD